MSASCSTRSILLELCAAEEHKKYAMEVPKIPPPIIAISNRFSEFNGHVQQIIIVVISY
jgi:hypothetical protein